ncbi:diguanylate cyclase domain-containing protein [Dokdonella sp.]|uniref:sensor domain-containing diguanylate cyclase n=1 Tax=Dokdonella sp. TaxID=2291710 RepID=UPI0035291795
MFARKHHEQARLGALMTRPTRSGVLRRPMLCSVVALTLILALAASTDLLAPPLLALLLTASVIAVMISLRRRANIAHPAIVQGGDAGGIVNVNADIGIAGETLFAASPVPMFLVDGEFLEITATNAAAAALYGSNLAEMRGWQFSQLQHSKAGADDAMGSPPVAGLARHRRVDGSAIWVELHVQCVQHADRLAWLVVVSDVTARLQLASDLEASERNARELIELSLGIVFTHDLAGNLQMVNPAFAHALGYPADELVGHKLSEFVVPRQHDAFVEYLLNVARNGQGSGAVHMLARDGSEQVWEFRNRLRTAADESQQVICCAIDISDRSRNERRLLENSRKDPLTGCYNRSHLAAFQADAVPNAHWACVVIDIDQLKRCNDAHGHRSGDQAIVRTARFLERMVRKDDSIVRLGGDEFVILLRDCDRATLESFASRLQAAQSTQETIPFSFGLAMRKDGEDLEQTIHRADRQMTERRTIERSSIRVDAPREPRRPNMRRSVIKILERPGMPAAAPEFTHAQKVRSAIGDAEN